MKKTKEQTFRFPVPRETVINANKPLNHRVKAIMIKSLRELGELVGKELKDEQFDTFDVDVYVYPPTKRRLDPPNLYPTVKPIIDGMTDAEIWEDDDWTHLQKMTFAYGGQCKVKDMFIIELVVKGEVL